MNVVLRVFESAHPPRPAQLAVVTLNLRQRANRTALRVLAAIAVSVLVMVLPLLHACGALSLLIAVPVVAWVSWRTQVLSTGTQRVACPKCSEARELAPGAAGWPIRLHCEGCGASFSAEPDHAGAQCL